MSITTKHMKCSLQCYDCLYHQEKWRLFGREYPVNGVTFFPRRPLLWLCADDGSYLGSVRSYLVRHSYSTIHMNIALACSDDIFIRINVSVTMLSMTSVAEPRWVSVSVCSLLVKITITPPPVTHPFSIA